ncbi:MAG: insulinase family protein [Ignavibacteriaceae bacterium]|nr:insulinase family protein [Ignavibacteriaceae bacterium]
MKFNRSAVPQAGKEIKFKLPEIKNFLVNDSLKVLFIKKDDLPIIRFSMLVNAGSRFDELNKNGLANLLALCIDEGAGPYDSMSLSSEFDLLGTHFSISADDDVMFFTVQTLNENFERSLELFSNVLLRPHLSPKDFERQKRKTLTSLIQLNNEPDYIASKLFNKMVFGENNPYAYPVIGEEISVKEISAEDLQKKFISSFSPTNSVLIVVGSITEEELINKLNQYLGDWKAKPFFYSEISQSKKKNKTIYIFNKDESVQTEIRVGHLSALRSESDYFPKKILNTILGGQFNSRININLREKNGFTYGARSSFDYYREGACFNISTSVSNGNTAAALKEIIKELELIRTGIEDSELEFAKSLIVRKFPSSFETYRQIIANLSTKLIFSLNDNFFDDYISNCEMVSKEQVEKAAKDSIWPDNLIIVLAGKKSEIIEQLRDFNGWAINEIDLSGQIVSQQ